eukprot:Clim_evm17s157 gene=Clim_evmTU17s157
MPPPANAASQALKAAAANAKGPKKFVRHSGLQKRVLAQYRAFLRAIKEKPEDQQPQFYTMVRREFDKNKTLPKMAVNQIEYFLRQGERRLKSFQDSHTRGAAFAYIPRRGTVTGATQNRIDLGARKEHDRK